MNTSSKPIFVFPSYIEGKDEYVFLTFDKKVRLDIDQTVMIDLFKVCDGIHTLENIVDYLENEYDRDSIIAILDALFEEGVLLDSRDLTKFTSRFGDNPSPWFSQVGNDELINITLRNRNVVCDFSHKVCELDSAYINRESVRSFDSSAQIEEWCLIDSLWKAYGETNHILFENESGSVHRRTVPSSGGLFALRILLVLNVDVGTISKGCYEIYFDGPGNVSFKKLDTDISDVRLAFIQKNILKDTTGCILIVGDLGVSAKKYGTRALRYAYLDAGHVAQQFLRATSEHGIDTLEVAGFKESAISEAFHLDGNQQPLVSIFFGKKSDKDKPIPKFEVMKVEEIRVCDGKCDNYTYKAVSQWSSDGEVVVSRGQDENPEIAKLKSVAELFEWSAFDRVLAEPGDIVVGSFSDLHESCSVIHPQEIAPYPDESVFHQLDTDQSIEWVKMKNVVSGESSLVPADFIFYPYTEGFGLYDACSSGCAAHQSLKEAREGALLEIVERDAFLVMWLKKLSMPKVRIPDNYLPNRIYDSMSELQTKGTQVHFVNLTLDTVPVILCVIVNENDCIVSMGSASHFDVKRAIAKAFDEAEFGYIELVSKDEHPLIITQREIKSVMDHGYYYLSQDRIQELSFIYSNAKEVEPSDVGVKDIVSLDNLVDFINNKLGLSIYEYALTNNYQYSNVLLRALRIIVPGLIPINFGYKKQPVNLKRINSVFISPDAMCNLDPEEGYNSLPHPFT